MDVDVDLLVCMCSTLTQMPMETRRGHHILGAVVTGSSKPPRLGSGGDVIDLLNPSHTSHLWDLE